MEPMPQQPQTNPYQFITDPQKQSSGPKFGGSMKSRIIIVAGLALLLIIAASVVSVILTSINRGPVNQLKDIVAQQEEIIRIAGIGAEKAIGVDTRSYAQTVLQSVQTDQSKLITQMEKSKISITKLELASKKNTKTEEALEAASAANRYDEAIKQDLSEKVADYAESLKSAYDKGPGNAMEQVLSESFDNANAILGQQ